MDVVGRESDEQFDEMLREWVESLSAAGVAYRGLDHAQRFADPGRYRPPTTSTAALDWRPVTRPELPRLVWTSFNALARRVELADDLEMSAAGRTATKRRWCGC